jgi:hypothetical protein
MRFAKSGILAIRDIATFSMYFIEAGMHAGKPFALQGSRIYKYGRKQALEIHC